MAENPKELVREHERLIDVLESPSHLDDKAEAIIQSKELAGYKRAAKAWMSRKLEKGAARRIYGKYDPREQPVPFLDAVDEWTETGVPERRAEAATSIRPDAQKEQFRAKNKLAGQAATRKNANGEREFLLHRGMDLKEKKALENNGNSISGYTSWTPKHHVAESFAREAGKFGSGGTVTSAWVPESKIALIPRQLGGGSPYKAEWEVILHPHTVNYATQDEVNKHVHADKLPLASKLKMRLGKSLLASLSKIDNNLRKSNDDISKMFGLRDKIHNDKNMSPEELTQYMSHPHPYVRGAAVGHQNATSNMLSAGVNDRDSSVAITALNHPKITKEHLDSAMKHPSSAVRRSAVIHPKAEAKHINQGMLDYDSAVRQGAVENPRASSDVVVAAMKDPVFSVRESAKKTQIYKQLPKPIVGQNHMPSQWANHHPELVVGLNPDESSPNVGVTQESTLGISVAHNPNINKNIVIKPNEFGFGSTIKYPEHAHFADKNFTTSHREAAYHKLASQFFKINNVPRTTVFKHPHSEQLYSAQEFVPGRSFAEYKSGKTAEDVKKQLNDNNGKHNIEKMAIMNAILGNHDRHAGNVRVGSDGKLALIDHGLGFDYGHWGQYPYPSYAQYHMHYNISPETIAWLQRMSPDEFSSSLSAAGVPSNLSSAAISRLMEAKKAGGESGVSLARVLSMAHAIHFSSKNNGKLTNPTTEVGTIKEKE